MKNIISLLNNSEFAYVRKKNFKKDEIIFIENEQCNSIGIIQEGNIQIISYSFNGNELLYNSLSANEIFGINLIFSNDPFYKGDVIAKENSTIYFIDKNNLIDLLQTNKDFLNEYLKIQSDFGKKLNFTIKMLSYEKAEERFMYFLFSNKNKITYKSITDLATILHLKRETLSRLLTKLEKRRLIRHHNKTIELI